MAIVREDTNGRTRDLPIHAVLRKLLIQAADAAGIAVVRVTSGGQCAKGTCTKRTGSTRHDLGYAADLQLLADGRRALDFTEPNDLPIVSAFVTAAAASGATGIGAGVNYMGPKTLHVGFGTSRSDTSRLVWGAGGASANAPKWLRQAAQAGWQQSASAAARSIAAPTSLGPFSVVARGGLKLRAGPGLDFPILSSIPTGTEVSVVAFEGASEAWARIDLEGDGLIDGHVHRAFLGQLAPLSGTEGDVSETEGDEDAAASEEVEEPGDA